MNAFLEQLGIVLKQLELNYTFFIQLGIFAVVFVLLSNIYFKPFLKLFEARHKRTVQDREAAEKLMSQAEARFEEYKKRLAEERLSARREYEAVIDQVKKEEAAALASAREEAKKITQTAAESITRLREDLQKSLEADVERIAQQISERLLSRKI